MARKSIIARERKRSNLYLKYKEKRKALKEAAAQTKTIKERMKILQQLDKLPKNSSSVRARKRCAITGRPRGNVGLGGGIVLCRNMFREWASQGKIPGVRKASW